jgi:hypothetical protein
MVAVDKLDELLTIQKSFQVKNQYEPFIFQTSSAIMAEGGELWAIAGGKWWKEYLEGRGTWGHLSPMFVTNYIRGIEKKNRAKIIEESIDVLHFLLIVWVTLGLKPDEVFEAYKNKMGINQKRQETNY